MFEVRRRSTAEYDENSLSDKICLRCRENEISFSEYEINGAIRAILEQYDEYYSAFEGNIFFLDNDIRS